MQTAHTIDSYIKTFPANIQTLLQEFRTLIKKEVPEAEEAISYGMPTFKLHKKNLVHFAAWNEHIGFYPTPGGIEAFKKELSKYQGAKGSIKFPLSEPMPWELITKIVQFRKKELLQK